MTVFSTFVGSVREVVAEFSSNLRLNLHYLSDTARDARQTITATVTDVFRFELLDTGDTRRVGN